MSLLEPKIRSGVEHINYLELVEKLFEGITEYLHLCHQEKSDSAYSFK